MNYWQIVGAEGRVVADYLDEARARQDALDMNMRWQTDEYRVVDREFTGDVGPVNSYWDGKRFGDLLPKWAEGS